MKELRFIKKYHNLINSVIDIIQIINIFIKSALIAVIIVILRNIARVRK